MAMAAIIGQQLQLEKRGNVIINRIQRELDILKDDREAQYKKLVRTYDISRQSLTDSIALYKLTQPDKLGFDEKTGTVFFQNPMTGEVYQEKISGFTPSEDPTALKKEYDEMVRAGYTGTLLEYAAFKAQQFGTEDGDGTISSNKDAVVKNLLSVGLKPEIMDNKFKLTKSNTDKILAKGVPSTVIDFIWKSIKAGKDLDTIRTELTKLQEEAGSSNPQEAAFGSLDAFMGAIQSDSEFDFDDL